jgi:hypothetical protein
MKAKCFELRDRATFVPVVAVKIDPGNEAERYLLRRAGFALPSDLVLMCGLDDGPDKATCDPYDWGQNRTRQVAHDFIARNFDRLPAGTVIDVEFILGETQIPKESEAKL